MGGQLNLVQLQHKANDLRQDVIRMLEAAGSGHTAGSLGMADILTALYFHILNIEPKNPTWSDRDIFLLSNGHTVPIQYAAMAEAGYFEKDELMTLRKLGSRLQGHPERTMLPGLENTSGPLGSGLSQACGVAYSFQYLDNQKHRFVYTIMGDGELDEGNVWEAAMFAGKYKLSQLICFIDRNNIQIDGSTEDVMPLEDLHAKWESFGWYVIDIDGNKIQTIIDTVNTSKAITNRPVMIIAHTVPGKGVDFMEYDCKWHGVSPNKEQAEKALQQLQAKGSKIDSGDIE
ncbi:transketolase [Candidatus Saccharibacteria bacterium CG11_big_fil_rev_8_21_14_0_20_41_19]|nr:transketolase [Candidatus Saccharibacteria bacterium]OIP86174.1 MAG: transketolase [Candidatus Saccharibacteria bacterium CG2_30_41_52]PIQ70984.1 MAG: transketolase [Candidatus Saccharibacteria bacterium CG11_big_fil_rev_8_21_14_0_20_41_19]PIZ60472.1 MAG: transketolase [Candidatus Saccharibacteria bacterium CG_4_10_14_0_2_um_filter_41_11]PJC29565.1 MAG: transketolase [Candidatus Saccharibacteria bacterium CG_4_9_14_0_2_um_filter_41_9]PJE66113.1 MAG: transketolase [Candidatus Saccharibacteri